MQEEENRDNEAFLIGESLKHYQPKDGEVFAISHVWNSDPVEAAEEIEVQFPRHMAYMTSLFDKAFSSPQQIDDLKSALTEDHCLVAVWKPAEDHWSLLVERDLHNLTREEGKQFPKEVHEAKKKELKCFVDLKVFESIYRKQQTNLVDARWVLKWKNVDGKRIVKARLCIRGFLDKQGFQVDTWSGTATRLGQRYVCSVVVQEKWDLCSLDIGNAFLRGITFEDLAKETGQAIREVCLDPPRDVWPILHELGAFKNGNVFTHILKLLKGAYGLKDAPRLWKKKLDRILKDLKGVQSILDGCIWYWHDKDGSLAMILSTHVDDLKGGGKPGKIKSL